MNLSESVVSSAQIVTLLRELHEIEDHLNTMRRRNASPLSKREALLREQLPEVILGHHDRMRIKGKRSIAEVRNGVCFGCYIALPVGDRARMTAEEDLHLCQNCGRYLYMAEVAIIAPVELSPIPKCAPVVPKRVKASVKPVVPKSPRRRVMVPGSRKKAL